MAIAFEHPPPVRVGQAPELLRLQGFVGPVQLDEVLLGPGVGKVRQGLGAQASIA